MPHSSITSRRVFRLKETKSSCVDYILSYVHFLRSVCYFWQNVYKSRKISKRLNFGFPGLFPKLIDQTCQNDHPTPAQSGGRHDYKKSKPTSSTPPPACLLCLPTSLRKRYSSSAAACGLCYMEPSIPLSRAFAEHFVFHGNSTNTQRPTPRGTNDPSQTPPTRIHTRPRADSRCVLCE